MDLVARCVEQGTIEPAPASAAGGGGGAGAAAGHPTNHDDGSSDAVVTEEEFEAAEYRSRWFARLRKARTLRQACALRWRAVRSLPLPLRLPGAGLPGCRRGIEKEAAAAAREWLVPLTSLRAARCRPAADNTMRGGVVKCLCGAVASKYTPRRLDRYGPQEEEFLRCNLVTAEEFEAAEGAEGAAAAAAAAPPAEAPAEALAVAAMPESSVSASVVAEAVDVMSAPASAGDGAPPGDAGSAVAAPVAASAEAAAVRCVARLPRDVARVRAAPACWSFAVPVAAAVPLTLCGRAAVCCWCVHSRVELYAALR